MKTARSTAASPNATALVGEPQPCFGPSITAQTSTVTPAMESTMPSGSKRRIVVSRDVGTTFQMATKATTITGTLTMNTEPQKKCSSRKPPVTGPRATARPLVAAQIEMAIARCRASVNTLTKMAKVAGKIRAAPTPIAARQPISWAAVEEAAARLDVAPKATMPAINVSLRPKRSPMLPAAMSNPANTST